MRKVLTKAYFGSTDRIDIDDLLYQEAIIARTNLGYISLLEEKFDIMHENFLEFEECILMLTARTMHFYLTFPDHSHEMRSLIDRRIINFLASGKMYTEQARNFILKAFGRKSKELITFDETIRNLKENSFGFNFCDYLRDFALHVNNPIYTIGFLGEREETEKGNYVYFCITPFIRLSSLLEDKQLPKEIHKELKLVLGVDDEFEVRPFLETYLAGLGNIQETVRGLIAPDIERWEAVYTTIFNLVKDNFEDKSLTSIFIGNEKANASLSEGYRITQNTIEHRKILVKKNNTQNLGNLGYVNNRIRNKIRTRKGS